MHSNHQLERRLHGTCHRRSRAALVAAFGLGAALWSSPALAYHTEVDRQTDYSAFVLQQNQFRLGLFELDYGILDTLQVGTYTLPWAAWIVWGDPALNLNLKWKFLTVDKFSLAASARGFFFDLEDVQIGDVVDEGSFKAWVVPMILSGSYVFDDTWTLNAEAIWVQTFVDPDANSGEIQVFGAAAQNNLQFSVSGEYRLTRVTAFNLIGRWVPVVTAAHISGEAQVEPGTTASVDAQTDTSDLENSFLFQGGVTFSWDWLNIKANCGYGDLILPGALIVAPKKTIVPSVDVYARF